MLLSRLANSYYRFGQQSFNIRVQFLELLDPEDEGITPFLNVGNCLPEDITED